MDFTSLACDLLSLLSDKLLVLSEPGHLLFELLDLTFIQGSFLHVLVSHALQFFVLLLNVEFSLVKLLLHSGPLRQYFLVK